ncbi:hypothetical protein [Aliterella atlantica]|uniref:hypothetical protein n=1 Tax=Aliterella atlantica TaxID=1827278 RepID=UPI001184B503|nr:hypothetical protein [Aliterella atlantica]
MNTHLRRMVISTAIAIATLMGSATISHSQSVQNFGPFKSRADCEAAMQALVRAGRASSYRCFRLPQNGRSNGPQNQSGKYTNELTPKEIRELEKLVGRDIPPALLRDPKTIRLVRDYLDDKRNGSSPSYKPYSTKPDLSTPSINTRIPNRSTEEFRYRPGEANGGNNLPNVKGRLLPDGRIGLIPGQIARRMQGMYFNNFGEFRKTFWKLVEQDPYLRKGWTKGNIKRMRQGMAPIAPRAEQTGGGANKVYQLDHSHDLQHGGEVYDLGNIRIVSPRFHQQYGRD